MKANISLETALSRATPALREKHKYLNFKYLKK